MSQELKANQVTIAGKVVGVRKVGTTVYTHIVLPAPDEYSSPAHVEVSSEKRIGQKDDQVIVQCNIGGYIGKEFSAKDKDTGEIISRRPVSVVLRAVE